MEYSGGRTYAKGQTRVSKHKIWKIYIYIDEK